MRELQNYCNAHSLHTQSDQTSPVLSYQLGKTLLLMQDGKRDLSFTSDNFLFFQLRFTVHDLVTFSQNYKKYIFLRNLFGIERFTSGNFINRFYLETLFENDG